MQTNLFNSHVSEIQVTYQPKIRTSEMPVVLKSKDAEKIFRAIWSNTIEFREESYMLLLNHSNRVLGWYRLSQGGTSQTIIDVKLVFGIALKCNAHGIILAHNHPSGNLEPSLADKSLTVNLKTCGKLLAIQILDHLIITVEGYFSFADERLL